jgi:hypothetical protein
MGKLFETQNLYLCTVYGFKLNLFPQITGLFERKKSENKIYN